MNDFLSSVHLLTSLFDLMSSDEGFVSTDTRYRADSGFTSTYRVLATDADTND